MECVMRPRWGDPAAQIKKLEEELWSARVAIIGLAPSKYRDLLKSYYRCEAHKDSYNWLDRVADQIIDTVEPLSKEQGSYLEPRAYCPLCGDGSSSPYDRGFAIPEGLRRHLTGWGRSSQCSVTEAAHQLALDYFHDKFGPAEEAERQAKEKVRAERIRTEVLLRTSPGKEPVLMDDVSYGCEPRDRAEFLWAESRLKELGFERIEEGRVRQYLRESDSFGVFADPRAKGEILFRVYRRPFPKRIQLSRIDRSKYFVIKDSWKNDVSGKFNTRLEQALEE
jgi:hypothetical protein